MKLITKISIRYLINSLLFLVVFSAIMFFAIIKFIMHESRGQMKDTRDRVILNLEEGIETNFPPFIETKKLNYIYSGKKSISSDTVLFNPLERKYRAYQQLTSYKTIDSSSYQIIVRASLVEKDDLAETIGKVLSLILIVLMISLFLINKRATNKILMPFYKNLQKLSGYSIKSDAGLQLEDSDIDEFKEMNKTVTDLSLRARNEYKLLKEFAENASHEIQTPLAVIKSTLDLLIQKNDMDDEITRSIQIFYSNVDKLSNLTKSLLLLAKIGNKEYIETSEINLNGTLQKQIDDLAEITASKQITVITEFRSEITQKINGDLLNILIGNLFSNAVRHNIYGGWIKIVLEKNSLRIENSGMELKQAPEKLFNRFEKGSHSAESSGLGLAIVKEICDLYGYSINYYAADSTHRIEILFTQTS